MSWPTTSVHVHARRRHDHADEQPADHRLEAEAVLPVIGRRHQLAEFFELEVFFHSRDRSTGYQPVHHFNEHAWAGSPCYDCSVETIGRQIQLPTRKAIEIAYKNIRMRLSRSLLVTSGIVLRSRSSCRCSAAMRSYRRCGSGPRRAGSTGRSAAHRAASIPRRRDRVERHPQQPRPDAVGRVARTLVASSESSMPC